jgi:hypothetical protein
MTPVFFDTNVLLAMIGGAAEPAIERWYDAPPPESV